IEERYGTNNTKLIQLNNLKNANHIWIGQRLKVPTP
ncbi:MAG: LysM peptidoglycan-binding domain-containing protein, partial [Candidatus Hydrogenedentes bacterium]|nr:LysM peptidoglycan-binding domain-containing protein [Candidatus Hydrogenedentota bacterium]